jgi:hypothetical protein
LEKKIPKDFPNQNPNPYEIGECIQRCQMVAIRATQHITIPMTDVFGTFLPIFIIFLKTRFGNLKSNSPEF